ncbi:MAG: type II secretion system protein [Candidatus Saccharibacteria bacterium]
MKLRGFTIVELVVIITVMGILMVLGVVNLSSSQANARDAERKGDIEAIAMSLETFYTSGTDTNNIDIGYYPPASNLIDSPRTLLRDIDPKALAAPGATTSTTSSLKDTKTPSISDYGYQCTADGDGKCRNFTLYYHTETTQAGCSNNICTVTSKNQ